MRRLLLLALPVMSIGCHRGDPAQVPQTQAVSGPIEAAGLHNVYRVTERLLSGSSPEGDEGFRSLRELGVKSIISVDGARPDVERARRFGLRYVHLPIGYDGVPAEQGLRIARAVRELPGLVYLHCHHGKHRGPAAAAVARLCLDERCSAADAVAWMRRAGTDPHYVGLYATVERFARPTAADLDRVSADFPEVAAVPAMAQVMVLIDERWEHLKAVRAAGWKVPPNHADLVPAHEALQLREHYQEAGRLPETGKWPMEFGRWMREAAEAAADLERALRSPENSHAAAEQAYRRSAAACVQCHHQYRDRDAQAGKSDGSAPGR